MASRTSFRSRMWGSVDIGSSLRGWTLLMRGWLPHVRGADDRSGTGTAAGVAPACPREGYGGKSSRGPPDAPACVGARLAQTQATEWLARGAALPRALG